MLKRPFSLALPFYSTPYVQPVYPFFLALVTGDASGIRAFLNTEERSKRRMWGGARRSNFLCRYYQVSPFAVELTFSECKVTRTP